MSKITFATFNIDGKNLNFKIDAGQCTLTFSTDDIKPEWYQLSTSDVTDLLSNIQGFLDITRKSLALERIS
jgi:hypothetical protein